MNVLLVEPNYKNKYPPMGLMKLSTYHKIKGDTVTFYKGIMSKENFEIGKFDRVYITSMFTFHYNIVVKTINNYKKMIAPSNIFVGGILVTLMTEKFKTELDKEIILLTGLLTNSEAIGFDDQINIDILPLDYSILDDITFKYNAGDNYFAYVSRGCTNKCSFCAVPILEPHFCLTNNIVNQINTIKSKYGEKQNLLLLDNNILSFDEVELQRIIDDIKSLGFDKTTRFYPELPLDVFKRKLESDYIGTSAYRNVLSELLHYLSEKVFIKKSKNYQEKYSQLIEMLDRHEDKRDFIMEHYDVFHEILSYYHRPVGRKRVVDFNQGIDARQLTEEKMAILAQIPIEPFRLAFDNMKYKDIYVRALKIAAKFGVKQFSNYILYNYDDPPEELWERLQINIALAKDLDIRIFSFPMKYAPIDRTDRNFVGKHWNKIYLSNLYAILNVTKGIVAEGENFFYKAFGRNTNEFYEILSMPRDFVMYRKHFEENGVTAQWRAVFNELTSIDKIELINALCEKRSSSNRKIAMLLAFYDIKK